MPAAVLVVKELCFPQILHGVLPLRVNNYILYMLENNGFSYMLVLLGILGENPQLLILS
uniref:Uncharacterized protein n=1 Tax=Anguilla anguilla TaxID=7936 RepID=A0A0E9WUS8_ANGAN